MKVVCFTSTKNNNSKQKKKKCAGWRDLVICLSTQVWQYPYFCNYPVLFFPSLGGGSSALKPREEEEDEVPELVGNFEEASKEEVKVVSSNDKENIKKNSTSPVSNNKIPAWTYSSNLEKTCCNISILMAKSVSFFLSPSQFFISSFFSAIMLDPVLILVILLIKPRTMLKHDPSMLLFSSLFVDHCFDTGVFWCFLIWTLARRIPDSIMAWCIHLVLVPTENRKTSKKDEDFVYFVM